MREEQLCATRRDFLKVSAGVGVGLLVSIHLPFAGGAGAALADNAPATEGDAAFTPNAWLSVAPDGTVTIQVNHSDMGQGIATALSMVVAEELDADWSKVRAEMAPAKDVYKNPAFMVQATGGSTSLSTSWDILREAGAVARAMLVAAAAKEWKVDPEKCKAVNGTVVHPESGKKATYGELAAKAGSVRTPRKVRLKKPEEFKIVGQELPRLDTADKTLGKTVYAIDTQLPGLLTAVVVRPPVYGSRLESFDATKAKRMPGVEAVFPISRGVAVVADSYWQARKASESVTVEWTVSDLRNMSSESIMARWKEMAKGKGSMVRDDGAVESALAGAHKTIEAVYTLPFQAHVCPEPMNCTAIVRERDCEVWAPTQNQSGAQEVASQITGFPLEAVKVHTPYLGGGFGRRFFVDYVIEAVEISERLRKPIKVIYSREDDFQCDFLRPAYYNEIKGGLDKDGRLIALSHKLVGPAIMDPMLETMAPSILPGWLPRPFRYLLASGLGPIAKSQMNDSGAVSGTATIGYEIPNFRVEYIRDEPGVPVGPWRSVGNSRNAFVIESFMDELADGAKQDPLNFRRKLLKEGSPRRGVLELAAKKAGWDKKPADGVSRGIALHKFHDTPACMVAEVSVDNGGAVKVRRIVCAVDCGIVVNPKILRAQIAGGTAFGLTATLKSSVTIEGGRVAESNYDDFPILTMEEMPEVEVYMVSSSNPPTGIGEVGVPPTAPAVANAIFAATGKRIRTLPIDPKELSKA